ncbi:MFS transporter [Brachybacterium endophyticum]|uniref:MFS transporter n=1 Tax=Brachybacterium endophyticum TaxID=2182385 RepID=A0A2U2RJW0_9MICO|nr:oligopeptide:H+ symporter [Brachybacterium endophyticum]PWH06158.1 MFS transporter [Brachybacterium endophyticum]
MNATQPPGRTDAAQTTASAPTDGSPDGPSHGRTRTFFGQPWPLMNLFSLEMWERFSYYGMQGILAIYMYFAMTKGGLGIDQGVATSVVGAYGGAVYVFCILGALVSDRLIGPQRTLFLSAVLIMIGHISLAVLPGVSGLVAGLLCVAIGSGGLKATAATLVGSLYAIDDPKRDAGFSIYYMGVNIGGLIGPLVAGLLQQSIGFHAGFAAAAIGMAIGLVWYIVTRGSLPKNANHVPDPLPRKQYALWAVIAVVAVLLVVVLVLSGVINPTNLANVMVGISAVAAIVIFAILLTSKKITVTERSRVIAFIPMFIGTTAFFALFQQQFTVLVVYADERLNRSILGWIMPISWPQSFNPFFILVLAPVFAALWTKLGRRQPGTPVKFAMGILLVGLAFLLFVPMAPVASVPVLWVVLIMFVATCGELSISPVGLSLATRLAPTAFPVMMMALYNLAVALGTALSGSLSTFYSVDHEAAYFGITGLVTVAVGIVMLLIAKPVTKGMAGVH